MSLLRPLAGEPELTNDTFRELEHSGWTKQAASYDLITPVTDQAIEPLLASFGEINGQHLLEVASGTGPSGRARGRTWGSSGGA